MLTTEVRVNGVLIYHFYIVNQEFINSKIGHKYSYNVCFIEKSQNKTGIVTHKQEDGALVLLKRIIEDIEKG